MTAARISLDREVEERTLPRGRAGSPGSRGGCLVRRAARSFEASAAQRRPCCGPIFEPPIPARATSHSTYGGREHGRSWTALIAAGRMDDAANASCCARGWRPSEEDCASSPRCPAPGRHRGPSFRSRGGVPRHCGATRRGARRWPSQGAGDGRGCYESEPGSCRRGGSPGTRCPLYVSASFNLRLSHLAPFSQTRTAAGVILDSAAVATRLSAPPGVFAARSASETCWLRPQILRRATMAPWARRPLPASV
jgi:hypothetical protein